MRKPVEYDALRHRVWVFGQRCHHGAGGALVAGGAVLLGERRRRLVLALTGSALMAHDWPDHTIWFERGYGSQP